MMQGRLSLADPEGSGTLVAAANWVRALITGTPATVVATLAVATVGFLMLQGRLPLRRGLIVVLGCFVIFGASAITEGLMQVKVAATDQGADVQAYTTPSSPIPPQVAAPPQPQAYDPYAGASVPVR